MFFYPPFCEMLTLEYRHNKKEKSIDFMKKIYNKLLLVKSKEEIIFNENTFKKSNKYYSTIIIK
jgi:primosomal protein N'